ncbi:MAG: phospholipase D family protein [Burkholderiales bacterium]|nr:phospholipase D family protein [Burkholderiales bacterium]
MLALLLLAGGCSTTRIELPSTPSFALPDPQRTALGRASLAEAAMHPGQSGFRLIVSGREALATRAVLADLAERTLDLQYYSAANDLTTDLLLLRIEAAAQRGVRVRILLDDIYPPTRQFGQRANALHPGIEVRLFNPFWTSDDWDPVRVGELLADAERLNRRMHNKLWIADNAVAIIGSRNLGDAYFDGLDDGNFSDVDLLSAGPIVGELSSAFDAYWISASAVPIERLGGALDAAAAEHSRLSLLARADACRSSPSCAALVPPTPQAEADWLQSKIGKLAWADADITFDLPEEEKTAVPSGIEHGWIEDRPGGARTQSELLIVSPYLVFEEHGLDHLADMRRRGIRVAVLTNSLDSTDSLAAHAGYARRRETLLASGVELFEMRPQAGIRRHGMTHRWLQPQAGSLHAKIVVQDRTRAIVGSLNQDPRSRIHNREIWLTVRSPDLAAELGALFDEATDTHHAYKLELVPSDEGRRVEWHTREGGEAVVHSVEPVASPWLKLWRDVLGALVPEHLL